MKLGSWFRAPQIAVIAGVTLGILGIGGLVSGSLLRRRRCDDIE